MQAVFWIVAKKLAGRAGPEVEPWNLEKIKEAGIEVILSADSNVDSRAIEAAGLEHLNLVMPSIHASNQAVIDDFVNRIDKAAQAAIERIKKGKAVLVHCFAGRDRTGLILCAVLMRMQKMTAQQALTLVRQKRPSALTGAGTLEILAEYDLKLKSGAL